jgi:hypothetical protein
VLLSGGCYQHPVLHLAWFLQLQLLDDPSTPSSRTRPPLMSDAVHDARVTRALFVCLVWTHGTRTAVLSTHLHTTAPPRPAYLRPGHVHVRMLHWSQSNCPHSQTSWSTPFSCYSAAGPTLQQTGHMSANRPVLPQLLCLAPACACTLHPLVWSPIDQQAYYHHTSGALLPQQAHTSAVHGGQQPVQRTAWLTHS